MTSKSKNLVEIRAESSTLESDPHWELAERVAASASFSRAAQLRAILLYVVRQAVLDPDEPILEAEIAHRVLGRRSDFNPLDDNIVRVQMAHLRKKLERYFSTEGKDEPSVITIALGSYKPVFSPHPGLLSKSVPGQVPGVDLAIAGRESLVTLDGQVAAGSPSQEPALESKRAFARRGWALAIPVLGGLAILALAVVCAAMWIQNRDLRRSLQTMQHTFYPWRYEPAVSSLWANFLDSNRDTDVVMSDAFFKVAHDVTKKPYTLNEYLTRSYVTDFQAQVKNPETRLFLGKAATWSSANQNHLKLARRILTLDPLGKSVHLYYAHDYRPDLIRQDNAILLGSRITNPWADLFDDRLNFEAKSDKNDVTRIINRAPAAGEQKTYLRADPQGYCVVAYLPNQSNNGKILLIEGTSVEATEAGGDFLLSEDQLSGLLKIMHATSLPYFEVLLKTSQVTGTPLTAAIEAYRAYPNLH